MASMVANTIYTPSQEVTTPLPTRQLMQRPNEQYQRLSSWTINYINHSIDKKAKSHITAIIAIIILNGQIHIIKSNKRQGVSE